MSEERSAQLSQILRGGWWNHGDPPILLDSILGQVEEEQQKQIMAMYLDHVAATLQAKMTLVQGIRSVMTSSKR
jgi:hypothetical protein